MNIENWTLDRIIPYETNPKTHQVDWIVNSIKIGLPENMTEEERCQHIVEKLIDQPIVVDGQGVIIKGHGRRKAAEILGLSKFPVVVRTDLSQEEVRLARIADNRSQEGGWDADLLSSELASLYISMPEIDFNSLGIGENWFSNLEIPDLSVGQKSPLSTNEEMETHQALTDRFIVPPFSILDTRQGYWQERKKIWKEKIKDRGESRENTLFSGSSQICLSQIKDGDRNYFSDVSILDPVLAEIVNLWFGLPQCKTFDCFAGDSVFGYVSSFLGNTFTGIELRQEQVMLNQARVDAVSLPAKYICDDGQNVLQHILKNSQDLLFSCPPYFDLEVYSDLPNDASNQKEYAAFLKILNNAFTAAIQCLKENRFAVIVIGDVRDKQGFYQRLPDDIKNIFHQNKMRLYNEIILIEQSGTGAIRAAGTMRSRKVVKTHQHVLVFFKGDPNAIKKQFSEITANSSDLPEGI